MPAFWVRESLYSHQPKTPPRQKSLRSKTSSLSLLEVARGACRRQMAIVNRSVSDGRTRSQPVSSLTLRVTMARLASSSGTTSKLALRVGVHPETEEPDLSTPPIMWDYVAIHFARQLRLGRPSVANLRIASSNSNGTVNNYLHGIPR